MSIKEEIAATCAAAKESIRAKYKQEYAAQNEAIAKQVEILTGWRVCRTGGKRARFLAFKEVSGKKVVVHLCCATEKILIDDAVLKIRRKGDNQ